MCIKACNTQWCDLFGSCLQNLILLRRQGPFTIQQQVHVRLGLAEVLLQRRAVRLQLQNYLICFICMILYIHNQILICFIHQHFRSPSNSQHGVKPGDHDYGIRVAHLQLSHIILQETAVLLLTLIDDSQTVTLLLQSLHIFC